MRVIGRYLLFLLLAACVLVSSCSREETRVIPRSKLTKIYAEMLVADQWIQTSSEMRTAADTMLIYEPILEKYGYSSADYRNTLNEYLNDPERFSRILRSVVDIYDDRIKELENQQQLLNEQREKEKNRIPVDFKLETRFPYLHGDAKVQYYDSLAVEIDSLTAEYRYCNIDRGDTLFEGPALVIHSDSLVITDSLSAADTLTREIEEKVVLQTEDPIKVKKSLNGFRKEKEKPIRQINRPVYNKDMKQVEELVKIEEFKE